MCLMGKFSRLSLYSPILKGGDRYNYINHTYCKLVSAAGLQTMNILIYVMH